MLTPGEYMGETRIKPAKLWFITMVIFAKDYIRVLIVIQMSNRNHIYTGKLDFLWQGFCSELVFTIVISHKALRGRNLLKYGISNYIFREQFIDGFFGIC